MGSPLERLSAPVSVEDFLARFDLNPVREFEDWIDSHTQVTRPNRMREQADQIADEIADYQCECTHDSRDVVRAAVQAFATAAAELVMDTVRYQHDSAPKHRPHSGYHVNRGKLCVIEASQYGVMIHPCVGDLSPYFLEWADIYELEPYIAAE